MRLGLLATLLGLGATIDAQSHLATNSPGSGVSFALNIPESTASSGQGDIFFQIAASTQFSWVALGQGDGMAGAQIFVLYLDSTGNNVTISPRLGEGHFEPGFNSEAQVTLLEGSGVSNGQMIANVRCSSCNKWKGGSMDFRSQSASWIYAVLPGSPKRGGASNTDISQHSNEGVFSWNMAKAKGGSSLNPFVTNQRGGGNGGGSTVSPVGGGVSSGGDSGLLASPSDYERHPDRYLNAHGLTASIAVAILFPLGGIVVRVLSIRQVAMLHAAIQIIGTLTFIAGFGLGVYIANQENLTSEYHPIIGIIVFVLLFIQAPLGSIHHRLYQKHGRRTAISHAHIWLGRIVITLAIINGGLGLKLADETSKGKKYAYGIVGGVMWLIYVASIVFGETKRSKSSSRGVRGEKGMHSSHGSNGSPEMGSNRF